MTSFSERAGLRSAFEVDHRGILCFLLFETCVSLDSVLIDTFLLPADWDSLEFDNLITALKAYQK